MYGAAIPAGNYARPNFGAMYTQRDGVSRRGALVQRLATRRALHGLGGGLGGENLCEDPGWIAAQAALGTTGAILSGIFSGTTTTNKYGKTVTTGGSTAGMTAGAGVSAATMAWQAGCAARTRSAADTGSAANTAELAALLAATQRNTDSAIAESRRASDQALQAMLMSQQRNGAVSQELIAGVPNQTLLLGGLAVGGVIAFALFLRK